MNKDEFLKAVKAVKEQEKKRNFKQSVDLIINLKAIDIKKQPIESYFSLPKGRGRKVKVCALIDKELSTEAKSVFDNIIMKDSFAEWQGNNKKIRKLVRENEMFVAQANIMPQIATTFGKFLGPKGKMPNPRSGAIVPPNPNLLKNVYEKLQNTVKLSTKNEAVIRCSVGMEGSKDEDIADNAIAVYNNVLSLLPQEAANIKSVLLKLTMSKPYKVSIR